MSLDFTTIDFETANFHAGSPCAVGLVKVRDGQIVDEFLATFMPPYPHDWFDPNNIKIHGIKKSDPPEAPKGSETIYRYDREGLLAALAKAAASRTGVAA